MTMAANLTEVLKQTLREQMPVLEMVKYTKLIEDEEKHFTPKGRWVEKYSMIMEKLN